MAMFDDDMHRNREWMRRVGEAIYGPSWQTPLSEALGVAPRSVRYWASGERTPPDGARADLAALCRARAQTLNQIASEMEAGLKDENNHQQAKKAG